MSSGQMHFIAIVGLVEVIALCIGVILLHPSIELAKGTCEATCLCWWLNPHFRTLGSWYDFGAGLAFNTLVNSFIGDTLLNSGIMQFIGRNVARFTAKKQPTQYLMDEAVRFKAPDYVPWRIVHLTKAWYFAVILMPVVPFAIMPLVVYHLLAFIVDRYNLLCALEPVPPSSGLCMRFVVTHALPLVVPLHFIVGFLGYWNALYCGNRAPNGVAFEGCVRQHGHQADSADSGYMELYIYGTVGVVLNAYLFVEIFVLQRRQALKLGLMTPWEVFKAGFQNDRGFGYASGAEPYRFVDVNLADVDLTPERMRTMFTAEVRSTSSRTALAHTENASRPQSEMP